VRSYKFVNPTFEISILEIFCRSFAGDFEFWSQKSFSFEKKARTLRVTKGGGGWSVGWAYGLLFVMHVTVKNKHYPLTKRQKKIHWDRVDFHDTFLTGRGRSSKSSKNKVFYNAIFQLQL